MGKFKDLTGQTFGRLTVLERVDDYISPKGQHRPRWKCQCECGNIAIVKSNELLRGDTRSCGCYAKEVKGKNNRTHGHSHEPLYRSWLGMKGRCYNPNNMAYKNYGGRGIVICDEWRNDYSKFREWALTHGYDSKLSLDRIDVNGNYEPDNCRYVTCVAQANNRRNNITITYKGETHNIAWWAKHTGMCDGTLYHRVHAGWTPEEILTTPT